MNRNQFGRNKIARKHDGRSRSKNRAMKRTRIGKRSADGEEKVGFPRTWNVTKMSSSPDPSEVRQPSKRMRILSDCSLPDNKEGLQLQQKSIQEDDKVVAWLDTFQTKRSEDLGCSRTKSVLRLVRSNDDDGSESSGSLEDDASRSATDSEDSTSFQSTSRDDDMSDDTSDDMCDDRRGSSSYDSETSGSLSEMDDDRSTSISGSSNGSDDDDDDDSHSSSNSSSHSESEQSSSDDSRSSNESSESRGSEDYDSCSGSDSAGRSGSSTSGEDSSSWGCSCDGPFDSGSDEDFTSDEDSALDDLFNMRRTKQGTKRRKICVRN